MSLKYTQRLKKNNYNKPDLTYTEKLTKDEIANKLEDYTKVEDINKVPIGTHLRYFKEENGKQLFRMGGQLFKNDGLPTYIILSNGTSTWSVQIEGSTFFKKMSINEIKQEYEDIIVEKDNEIKKLLSLIKKYKKQYNIQ